jgi:hypothetical protein
MCTKYSTCGRRHQPKWKVSKLKRNRKGQFTEGKRLLTQIFLGVMFFGAVSAIGWNTIINTVGVAFQVENSQAVETITEVDFKEARIASLINKVYKTAKVHGVSGYQMERTIECESRFNNVQSSAYKNGVREDSWGLAQIHLPSHPDVTREEALNEDFAIEWMASHFYKVKWYGYVRSTDKCQGE